ncbi:MAG: RagB/SusD family nutrient uptake outer membrane protein [Anditalea sp.]
MKNIKHILQISLLGLLLMTSCNEEFLETQPLDEFADAAVWGDEALAQSFINNIYQRLDQTFTQGRLKGMIVDEAHYRGNTASLQFNRSQLTADGIPSWGNNQSYSSWNELYKSVRFANMFLENADRIPADQEILDRMKGEAHFLRGYLYHLLMRQYGGVPLISRVFELVDEFNVPRNTLEETVDFIVADLDEASRLLPDNYSGNDIGRAIKGAALALKSRVLVRAASDLYNTSVFPEYAHPELIGYISGDRTARWQAAKDAAKAVIDLGMYSMYKADPAPGEDISENFVQLFISKNNEEDIFLRYFTLKDNVQIGLVSGPNGWHNWGTNAPLGDLVDDYAMADGSSFDWNNPEHAARPYENREPRFYATILYEGAKWRPRPEYLRAEEPEGVLQVGKWEVWDPASNSIQIRYGLDTRQSPIENWNGSYTGYYSRKFLDPQYDHQYIRQDVPYRFIRYTEILLNYVEACIELGEYEEARTYLNRIRKRAGLPAVNESGEALRELYRLERRIELALEDHRIWDVRRWVIGPEAYDKSVLRAEVEYQLKPDMTTDTVPTIQHVPFEDHEWIDKAYFFPILRDEMNRNELLIQNPGY